MDFDRATLAEWDRRHFWHPFTQMQAYGDDDPWIIARAEGNYLYDLDGRCCLDAISSLWCNVHGHRHPRLDAALRRQLDLAAHTTTLGVGNPPAIVLAKTLADMAPEGLSHVFYSEDGAEAVEVAIKMAYHYWRNLGRPEKCRFVTLDDAYHGDTLGAVSVGGIPLFHRVYGGLLFDAMRLPSPYVTARERFGEDWDSPGASAMWLERLSALLEREGGAVAALVLESGIQGAAGLLPFPMGILAGARELCNRHDCLLILDEVATGFGRTGTMFSCEREGVAPDLMALGKGLSGGYLPLAATLANERVYQAFLGPFGEARQLYHGHTYTGNPLACAVALENLAIFREEGVLDFLPAKVGRLSAGLAPFRARPDVSDVRQLGLMAGIALCDPRTRRAYPYGERVEYHVCRLAREMGVYSRPLGDTLVIFPPLSITEGEIDRILAALWAAMGRITGVEA